MLSKQIPITDKELVDAIATRCDPAAGAIMALAASTKYLREFTVKQLIAEAQQRKLDLSAVTTSVHGDPLLSCARYRLEIGTISQDDYQRWWRRVKATGETAMIAEQREAK